MGSDRVLLAIVGAAHGVKGDVRIKSFTAEPMSLADYGPLVSEDGRSFTIERLRPAKGDMLVAKFKEIDDRNAAERLNGLALHVARSALPDAEPDEFYHADLIGLTAVDPNGVPLGKVVAVHDFGAGDILDIETPGGPSLQVPFTKAVVPEVDVAAGRITVIPPGEVEGEPQNAREEEDTA